MRTPTGFRWSSRSLACRRRWAPARVLVALGLVLPVLARTGTASADPIAAKQAEAARLARQVDQLGIRQSQLAEAYDQAVLHVADVNAKLAAARANLGKTDGLLGAARSRVRDMAVSSYMNGGTATQLQMFIPKSANELTVRTAYMQSIAAGTTDAIDALRAAHLQIGEQQATLTAEQAAATKALAAVDAARRSAQAADQAERAALARVRGELGVMVAAASAAQRAVAVARLQADVAARQAPRTSQGSFGGGGGSASGSLPPPPPGAAGAVEEARRQLGKPYEYGGAGPDSFDCSGLTAWAWGHAGRSLPHSAAAQYDDTTHIPVSALQPGDLVFYGSPPHHVGIYVGGGEMINALHSGTNVEYDSIYMEGDLIGGGRVN